MQIFVRRALATDTEALNLLFAEGKEGLDLFRGGSRHAVELGLENFNWGKELEVDSNVVFVSGVQEVVMGYLFARSQKLGAQKVATIEQVFVTHDARNFGIGDALVLAALDWARSESFSAVDGLALPGDRETKNLFERSGLVARLITVTTDLKN